MKFLTKAALGALLLAGSTALTVAPAAARVTVGVEFGGGGYRAPAYCDRYSRWYDPYRCDRYDALPNPRVWSLVNDGSAL